MTPSQQSKLVEETVMTDNPTDLPEAVVDFLHELDGWESAYPLSAFPEPDLAKAADVLKANGMTLDAISASNMRHVISEIAPKARAAIAASRYTKQQKALASQDAPDEAWRPDSDPISRLYAVADAADPLKLVTVQAGDLRALVAEHRSAIVSKAPAAQLSEAVVERCREYAGRADDCGRLARDVLAALIEVPRTDGLREALTDSDILELAENASREVRALPAGYLVDPGLGSAMDKLQRNEPTAEQCADMAKRGGFYETLYTGSSVERMITHAVRAALRTGSDGGKR